MSARDRLPVMAAGLWWGSLSVIGFMAVPLLFAHLPTPAMAGQVAARLFQAQTYVSMVACALLLILLKKPAAPAAGHRGLQMAWYLVVLGLLLALLLQHGVAPRIIARENLRLWHGLGSLMYSLQWLCAGITLWLLAGHRPAPTRE